MMPIRQRSDRVVVLVHGLGGSRVQMMTLGRRLRKLGYRVKNWGYQSLFSSIDSHGARLAKFLGSLERDPSVRSISIVAHSMGAIVTRSALTRHCANDNSNKKESSLSCSKNNSDSFRKIESAALLGPPNAGSPVASRLSKTTLGRISKPLSELCDQPDSYVNQLPQHLGVPFITLVAGSDILVPQESTRLASETFYSVLPSLHASIVFRKDAVVIIDHFFRMLQGKECPSLEQSMTEEETSPMQRRRLSLTSITSQ